jgi:hypothetical protein
VKSSNTEWYGYSLNEFDAGDLVVFLSSSRVGEVKTSTDHGYLIEWYPPSDDEQPVWIDGESLKKASLQDVVKWKINSEVS